VEAVVVMPVVEVSVVLEDPTMVAYSSPWRQNSCPWVVQMEFHHFVAKALRVLEEVERTVEAVVVVVAGGDTAAAAAVVAAVVVAAVVVVPPVARVLEWPSRLTKTYQDVNSC